MIHYGTTKTAQLAISRGLAETVAGTGVTVNAVLPGPTRSEGVAEFFAKLAKEQGVPTEELEKRFVTTNRPTSLLKRIATVEEVANMGSPQPPRGTGHKGLNRRARPPSYCDVAAESAVAMPDRINLSRMIARL
jgi:NAD(P)-dependent dehydrogenase (short-subunit alcohol dehydrogenase family)